MDEPQGATADFNRCIAEAAAYYRDRNRLADDSPVTVILGGDGRTAYLCPEGAWKLDDGGTLDLGIIRDSGCRCRSTVTRRAHRIWSWVRWAGWRR